MCYARSHLLQCLSLIHSSSKPSLSIFLNRVTLILLPNKTSSRPLIKPCKSQPLPSSSASSVPQPQTSTPPANVTQTTVSEVRTPPPPPSLQHKLTPTAVRATSFPTRGAIFDCLSFQATTITPATLFVPPSALPRGPPRNTH